MLEKDNTIKELKSTIEIFELKINKMEQLIKVKDNKIQSLVTKLQQAGINWIFFTILFIDKQFFYLFNKNFNQAIKLF